MALNLDYRVTLVDSSGSSIATGGTQYADGATQANPTGNAVLWLDTSNVLRAVSVTKPLPVQGGDAAGAGITRNPFVVAGQNGGNAKLWAMNATGQGTVTGALSHNNAAPGTDMLQAMGALANAAVPTYTEGNIVLLSTNLAGAMRVVNPSQLPSALVSNRLDVNLGAAPATVTAQGAVAAAAAVSGNPISIGGRDASGNSQFIGGNNNGVFAQGPVAANTALAGNPVRVGISDGTNVQNWGQVPALAAGVAYSFATAGPGLVGMGLVTNSSQMSSWSSSGNGDGLSGLIAGAVGPYLYNGVNFDRQRNNVDATLLASAARTTTQTSADITTYNCQGIIVTVDTTVVPGSAPSNVLTINYKDPTSGKYITLLTGAAITGVGTVRYRVDPRLLAVANLVVNDLIGRTIQIVLTCGNANAATYTIGYTLVPG